LPIDPELAFKSPDVLKNLSKEMHLLAALEHVNIGALINFIINYFIINLCFCS
jgi:hypothetical protein